MKSEPLQYVSPEDGLELLCENSACTLDIILNPLADDTLVKDFFTVDPNLPYSRLFYNTPYEKYLNKSPYIITVPGENHPLVTMLVERGSNWGFFASGAGTQKERHEHWKSLANAQLTNGNITHFRFYSNVVLRNLLLNCTNTEKQRFLGPYVHLLVRGNGWLWAYAKNPFCFSPEKQLTHYLNNKKACTHLWQVQAHHFNNLENTMRRVMKANIANTLWGTDFEAACYACQKYVSLESFVANSISQSTQMGIFDEEDTLIITRAFLYHGFHIDLRDAIEKHKRTGNHLSELIKKSIKTS